ncbi:MAG: TolC family protein [Aquabacterium sp.]|nr:TolC family protein [Aquabacterium sp.]
MEVLDMLSQRRHAPVAWVVGLLMGLSLVHKAQAQVPTETLAQALDAAWTRSPHAVALRARQDETQAGLELARGLTPGPASVSVNHLNDRLNQNIGRREWEFEVSTPLWLPGQKRVRASLAENVAIELDVRHASLKLQMAAEVREAWWRVAAARDAAALAHQRLDTAQELEGSVMRRFKTGDLARVDANLVKAERLTAQAELLDAEGGLQQAMQGYRVLMGEDAPAALPAEHAQPQALEALSTAYLVHPQVRALQALTEVAQSRLAVVDASQREAPELAVRWATQRGDGMTPYDQAVGVKLTIPLSSGGRVRQDGAAAQAELAQAEAALMLAQTSTQQEVIRAQSELDIALRQVVMAQERQALTTDNLTLAQRSFSVGESDLPTLMRARAASHEAQAWFKRQETAHALAQSRLLQAQGVLP